MFTEYILKSLRSVYIDTDQEHNQWYADGCGENGNLSQNAAPLHQEAQAIAGRRAGVWHNLATLSVALLIVTLPLPRHWILLDRRSFQVYYEFTSILFYLSDVAVILVLLTSAVWFWQERPAVRWGPAIITLPLALLPVVALATAPWAGDPVQAIYVTGRLVVLLAVYLAIVALRPSARVVQISLAASLMLQTAVAMAQFLIQRDLGWRQLGEIPLSPTPGLASIITAGDRVWLRGYGLTPHPNILGGILVTTLLALVVPYLESHDWRKVVWLTVLVGGGVGLVISFSRAAWLGGVVGSAVLFLGVLAYRPWRRQYARAILVPAVVGLVVLAGFAFARRDLFVARLRPPTTYTEARSLDERRVLADASLDLIRRSPLTGVGAGNFSMAVVPLVEDVPATTPQPVHNLPLLLSAELGLAGGVLWVWLMLAPVFVTVVGTWQAGWAIRLQRYLLSGLPRPYTNAERPDGKLSLWVLGLTAGLVALAIIDLFDFYSWGWPQGRLLRWVFLALWAGELGDAAG
jgi:O-antigen ligase